MEERTTGEEDGTAVVDYGFVGILIGMLCGAAVGVERQWSGHASGPEPHFGGIRTFTLLGGLSGISGFLWLSGYAWLAAILLAGAVGLVVVGYVAVSRHDTDATTEVAGLIVAAAGLLAGLGLWELASAIVVVTALLLVEKSRLHTLVSQMSDVGIRSGFHFALMAVVILPLLPEGPYGPLGGVRPRELWLLVLFFSGLSFAAYIIRSIVGPGRGYVVAGLLGGLISSTNVTFTFSRMSREEKQSGISLALGVLAACTMMYLRVGATAAVLNQQFGLALVPYLAAPAIAGAGFIFWGLRRTRELHQQSAETANPLQLRSALQMAALFQIVLYAVTAVKERWGETGMMLSGAMLGFTDMDALVISMAKAAGEPSHIPAAVMATIIGTLSNTVLKFGFAVALGEGRYRLLTGVGLAGLAAVSGVALVLWRQ
jgi:uncharacterized membrane protein (DUF4010 family)